ncbi:MAG: hypothetical protein J7L66_00265 [Anaerolineaceae bacterium]|nr:hypothetical protein [Anaerolineaceae bacterium]
MTRNNKVVALASAMMIVLACTVSFGGGLSEEEKMQTAVAQTIAAGNLQPQNGQGQPLPTITLAPTATKKSDPTQTPLPCNKAKFISETIPDDTEYTPGKAFTKTWRLQNIGTCTWNTNYKLVYASGDKMGGPANKNLTQSVAPGEQVDISVDLTAPASEGTYKGFWKVADDEGQFFVNTIWVQIKVKSAPLNTYNVTLNAEVGEGGSVWSNGDVYPGEYGVGDAVGDFGIQTFIAFDISGIPSSAIIQEVKVDFTNFITFFGNPFNDLGCLRMYPQTYRPLSAGDYTPPPVTGADARWCNAGELGTVSVEEYVKDYLQSRLGNTWLPVRLQFNEHETDGHNDNDLLSFSALKLNVKYKAP